MSLKTFSAFIYGHDIDENRQFIDFSEDGGLTTLFAQVEIGSYTAEGFIDAVADALNAAGDQDYTVTLNRFTRKITVAAQNPFNLIVSGPHGTISAFELMGFTLDKSGASSYEADIATGYSYEPQYKLQRYVDFEDNVEAVDSSVNTSADGTVEVVSFGQNHFMECNITYATDIIGQGAIKNNANGVADLRRFMNYAILKKPMEFIPDIDSPEVYSSCILESTRSSSKGTGFTLYELYGRGLANYYETGALTFRRI